MSNKNIIMINNNNKKSFYLIKEIMSQYVLTLEELTVSQPSNDLYNKTNKNLILDFIEDIRTFISKEENKIEFSNNIIDILKETLNFYWQNGKEMFSNYSENDYVNACNLLNQKNKSFIKQ